MAQSAPCWSSCRARPQSSAEPELRWRQPCRRGQLLQQQQPQTTACPPVSPGLARSISQSAEVHQTWVKTAHKGRSARCCSALLPPHPLVITLGGKNAGQRLCCPEEKESGS